MSPLNITQPLGIWSTRWLLFLVMSFIAPSHGTFTKPMGLIIPPLPIVVFGHPNGSENILHICKLWCWNMALSENVVYPEKPNGFADHYPVFKWLFHWGYTPFFKHTHMPSHSKDLLCHPLLQRQHPGCSRCAGAKRADGGSRARSLRGAQEPGSALAQIPGAFRYLQIWRANKKTSKNGGQWVLHGFTWFYFP